MQRLPMAKSSLVLVVLALASISMCTLPSFASANTSDCTSAALSLAPCLSYMTGKASTPSPPCCSQLAALAQSQPQCLCALLNGGASSAGITLNKTRALALPGACNVQTPPVSSCSGPAKAPPASPTAPNAPAAPASESPPAPETPGGSPPATLLTTPGGGSTTCTAAQNSGGSSYSSSLLVAVFSVTVAAAASLCQFMDF